MPELPNQQNTFGLFVSTTDIWDDIQKVLASDAATPEMKELFVKLYQIINKIVLTVNVKDSAYYVNEEFVTGQQFFATTTVLPIEYRPSTRMTVNFGALPNTATKSVAHGLTFDANTWGARVYGAAYDPVSFLMIPLPYASPTLANNIELNLDATNVNVITGSNRSTYTRTIIVVEFLKY